MRVIGTAGHVDHGKSTLITALTGINPDRLKEEQEREMTIDLGFAWLSLPDGEEVGIVDVPGHRDFIENMLAGVGGIDAALLIIAADEGVMPQTREHLAILNLLQIQAGIVVLTKIDLVKEAGWLDLVENDIHEILQGTSLADAPIVRVSARTRLGLDDLVERLSQVLKECPARVDANRPRLPVDRVFSIAGFGTVVTGTLTDGCLSLSDEVEILPSGGRGRIRGLQTHKKKEDKAFPGSRTAINISGINAEQIQRGEVITHPGKYRPTRMLDVQFQHLPDASNALRHASEVKFFLATSETIARVRLLGVESLEPGQKGWLQLELRDPVVAVRGDHYIMRRPSPGETLGGGIVVDPNPRRRHKRFAKDVIGNLEAIAQGAPPDVLLQASLALGPATVKDVIQRARLEAKTASPALEELVAQGKLIYLEEREPTSRSDTLVMASGPWTALESQAGQIVDEYHKNFPLRSGIPREELKSRLKLSPRVFNAAIGKMAAESILVESGAWIARPTHLIQFDEKQQIRINQLLRRFAQSPYAPPTIKECQTELGEEVYTALVEKGEMVPVSSEVVFLQDTYQAMIQQVRAFIEEHGQMTVAEARDLFGTSRRYVLALLEHLDAIRITVREGDYRRLHK